MGAIFYVSLILNNEAKQTQTITPIRTKAAGITYKKSLSVGSGENSPTPTMVIEPTPTTVQQSESQITPTAILSPSIVPSPTEIILAQGNLSAEENSPSPSTTAAPTDIAKITSLPESGFINNALIIFTVSSLLIFFAFLF